MTPESVVLRAAARRDVDEAITHYLKEAGSQVVLGFIEALQEAFGHIADNPRSGSHRHGHEVNLPGLRSRPLRGYPHLAFYMTGHNRIDFWRILHDRRDVPEWLRDS
ncbi:MAG: type II toxin-antitoxin system RelE/ParE family toxin [Gemmatimonadetes bacterium]|nr:type II toxin-antitoxin system RelE/ParE family toxin [Candidatus Palauibacter australiensis]MCY3699096.1 type II toxin-antitoxin system RelE/ParE family toxin [Gemmatimonadota bacterium]